MKFSKYQGIGNDFVMVADQEDEIELSPANVMRLCDRRFGIGADGVIRVAPDGNGADFFMDYRNSDGSVGEMCGNGIRCLAVFVRELGLTRSSRLSVGTRAGVKTIEVLPGDLVTVDMGRPVFDPATIPVSWPGPDALHAKVELPDETLAVACLSIGNPHAVVFVEDLEPISIELTGPQVERHPMFPNGTNVEWVRVAAPDRIEMVVWERGSGATLACGTGACAGAVASRMLRGTDPEMTVVLPGGELRIEWAGDGATPASVFMTGPATKSFEGEVDLR
jgi:diaminopimelate epimerase